MTHANFVSTRTHDIRSAVRDHAVALPRWRFQVGSKGLEIKVDNPESYNFRPKEMLKEICTTISQFSTQPGFHKVRPESALPPPVALLLAAFCL